MPMAGPSFDDGAGDSLAPQRRAHASPRRMRRLARSMLILTAGLVLLLGGGFLWFLWIVPDDEIALSGNADGIVALTGGASRVADAMELMAAGHGRRLLISGANRSTTLGEISRLNPEYARVVGCCVDFDRSVNTLGNAVETRRWAESRGFRSLIVVTSNYHMPRALAEIAHQLPDVKLLPFPVVTDKQRTEAWWSGPAGARLMFSEYVKYMFARIRMSFVPPSADEARQARAPL